MYQDTANTNARLERRACHWTLDNSHSEITPSSFQASVATMDTDYKLSGFEASATPALEEAARRKLITNGVPAPQIRKVAGFSDTAPMPNSAPEDEVNRRVAILLKISPTKH